jgi:hypothetical protein
MILALPLRVLRIIRNQVRNKWRIIDLKVKVNKISTKVESYLLALLKSSAAYVESLRIVDPGRGEAAPYGRYYYKTGGQFPLLYASVFAALFRHLRGELEQLTPQQRGQWAEYINDHQHKDGLFRDPLVANEIAETEDWWGWRHLTLMAIMALHALGARPRYALEFLKTVDTPAKVRTWLDRLDWGKRASYTSNKVQNYGAAMQYARDFMGEPGFKQSIKELLAGVSQRCDPNSGLWGKGIADPRAALSDGVQAGYHFWLLFWYDRCEIPYYEKAFESIVRLQNGFGGFDLRQIYSSACQDIDGLHPLIKLAIEHPHLQEEARAVVQKSIPWIIYNFNKDGGAPFQRYSSFFYGHQRMFSGVNESSIFPTWFRTLSLSYCCDFLEKFDPGYRRFQSHYLDCPGLQYALTH